MACSLISSASLLTSSFSFSFSSAELALLSDVLVCDLDAARLDEDALFSAGLPVISKFSGEKNKIYTGEVEVVSSRINADTRSILTRVKIDNSNFDLIPGSLLEVTLSFNERNSLSIPDTSIILEGNKAYVYKITDENIANRLEIKMGLREDGNVEVISGLSKGDIIVAIANAL